MTNVHINMGYVDIKREPVTISYSELIGWDKNSAELAEIGSVRNIDNIVDGYLSHSRMKNGRTEHFEEGLRCAFGIFGDKESEALGEHAARTDLFMQYLDQILTDIDVTGDSNILDLDDYTSDDAYITEVMKAANPFRRYAVPIFCGTLILSIPLIIIYALNPERDKNTEENSGDANYPSMSNYSFADSNDGYSDIGSITNDLDMGSDISSSDITDAPLEYNISEDSSPSAGGMGSNDDGNSGDDNDQSDGDQNNVGAPLNRYAQYTPAFRQTLCDYLSGLSEEDRTTVVDLRIESCDMYGVMTRIINQIILDHDSSYSSFLVDNIRRGDLNSAIFSTLLLQGQARDQRLLNELWREQYSEILRNQDITSYCGDYASITLNTAGCVSDSNNNHNGGGTNGI